MAEGWLKVLGGDRFEVFSAGSVAHRILEGPLKTGSANK